MKASKIAGLLSRIGLFGMGHTLWPNRLTVLAYHRVTDPNVPGFDTFKPNVSATPAAFAAQMDFISQHFNVVSIGEVLAWLQGSQALPDYPALITFDDGYLDNLDYALPILQQRNLPAIIFLVTDYIGKTSPFYWDLIAYCFHHTCYSEANLPLIGQIRWSDKKSQTIIMANWLNTLKKIPDSEKWAAVRQLPQSLKVSIPENAFSKLYLTWDQVRMMVAANIDMGAHTQSHSILTRISSKQARIEITNAKVCIEAEINRPVTSFAYPNGLSTDFNPALQTMLQQVGIEAAFTLVPGPTRLVEVKQNPMAIRRVFLHYKDTLPRFAAKVMGISRLIGILSK